MARFQKGRAANPTGVGGFKKGVSGNPAGRPKELAGVRELARQHGPKSIETMVELRDNPNSPPAVRLAASQALLDRGFGRPEQHSSVDVSTREITQYTDADLLALIAAGQKSETDAAVH